MSARKAPDAFRTIGEVAAWLGVSAHVLRFWETKFPQIKPVKRAGGRRYYRPQDMALLGGIRQLLHEDGLTIRGAQKVLREKGVKAVAALSPPLEGEAPGAPAADGHSAAPSPDAVPTRPATDVAEEAPGRDDTAEDAEAPPTRPATAGEEARPERSDLPPRAPLPGVPAGQLGLFGDLPPLVTEPEDAPHTPAGTAPTGAPSDPSARGTSPTDLPPADLPPADLPPADLPPTGLPPAGLPPADLPMTEALSRLVPGQVPAEALAPVLARAEALRARMQTPRQT